MLRCLVYSNTMFVSIVPCFLYLFLLLYGNGVEASCEGHNWTKISILPVYHDSINSLGPSLSNYIKCHLVDAAVTWLHEALSVERTPLPSSLLLDRECPFGTYISPMEGNHYCRDSCSPTTYCGPIPVDKEYTKPCKRCSSSNLRCYKEIKNTSSFVSETHFVLHVASIPTRMCSLLGVVTDGGTCQQDAINDRPIVGYLNICPNSIDTSQYLRQVLHVMRDILEALAFSYKLLPFFRNSSGQPIMPRTSKGHPRQNRNGQYAMDHLILSEYLYTNWTSAADSKVEHWSTVIRLPAVLREARKHFNCSTLQGLPLEDQSSGRLLWESRIMLGDIMTNVWLTDPVISAITLALLEDSGWYKPDYRYAGILHWGRDEGCGFITSSCADTTRHRGSHSFCNDQYMYGCTPNYLNIGQCFKRFYPYELPVNYQYFSIDSHFGGTVPLIDYCPLYTPFSTVLPNDRLPISVHCDRKDYKCIEHNGGWSLTDRNNITEIFKVGAGCYSVKCNRHSLKLTVGDKNYYCRYTGQILSIYEATKYNIQYSGEIICPPYNRYCHGYNCVNHCSGHGRCVEGFCHCYPGYYGVDCNLVFTHRYIHYCACMPTNYVLRHNSCGCYCDCAAAIYWGRSGYRCENQDVPVNKCTPTKCRHGRCTRINEGRGFKCICNPGYFGKRCDNCPNGFVSRKCKKCEEGWKCHNVTAKLLDDDVIN